MKICTVLILALSIVFFSFQTDDPQKGKEFNTEKDILLAQFDCKTDVDDLHSVAAFITLMSHPDFSDVNYYAVAGAYGVQEGLYVPPNALFQLAFGDRWSDAHQYPDLAVKEVKAIIKPTLLNCGDVWIAEAGQSDFSARLIKAMQNDLPDIDTKKHIHIVQHSNWNEDVTSEEALKYVKQNADYKKIPDGNEVGNGTPGFRTPDYTDWKKQLKDPKLKEIWSVAIELANKYNGKDGRYNNEAVESGGLDFSDISETCYILGIQDIKDSKQFFKDFGR
ncbi:hypothetical protein [Maribellus mangrovi]|uniref:hypothetical protein n=1 Tax=Maribellus mangrovi TaxID=3133146 RepID=UPI0030EDE9F3